MFARSGSVGKKSSWPYLGPSETIFSMDRKKRKKTNVKILPVFLGGPMGPIHPVWALAAIHPRYGVQKLSKSQFESQFELPDPAEHYELLPVLPSFSLVRALALWLSLVCALGHELIPSRVDWQLRTSETLWMGPAFGALEDPGHTG